MYILSYTGVATFHSFPRFMLAEFPVAELPKHETCLAELEIYILKMVCEVWGMKLISNII